MLGIVRTNPIYEWKNCLIDLYACMMFNKKIYLLLVSSSVSEIYRVVLYWLTHCIHICLGLGMFSRCERVRKKVEKLWLQYKSSVINSSRPNLFWMKSYIVPKHAAMLAKERHFISDNSIWIFIKSLRKHAFKQWVTTKIQFAKLAS